MSSWPCSMGCEYVSGRDLWLRKLHPCPQDDTEQRGVYVGKHYLQVLEMGKEHSR